MKLVGVRLNDNGKIYYFDDNELNLVISDKVIVETEKGLQYGIVICFVSDDNMDKHLEYKKVIRIVTKADEKKHLSNLKDASKALVKCNNLVKRYGLNMKIIDASYTHDREQLIFRFISDERVDFRQLAKDLGAIYKTRIELRQVGIRDKAKEIGGIGPCGRKLCCNSFLSEFDSVSINMAKNQNLSLNPSKINGVCGRLLCCLTYENDNYFEYKKGIPNVGAKVSGDFGEGKVMSIDIFKKNYKVLLDTGEVITIDLNDSKK